MTAATAAECNGEMTLLPMILASDTVMQHHQSRARGHPRGAAELKGGADVRPGAERPTLVIALGGNALLRRSEPMTAEVQRRNIRVAVGAIAPLTDQHRVVVAHGNGPQVGLLALQAEAYTAVAPYPLDVLGAGTQ